MNIEQLKRYADAGDADALRILTEIERYVTRKEAEKNNDIRSVIKDMTVILSKPEAVTGRDDALPLQIADLANEWVALIATTEDIEIVD